jgi:hypothetical protein
MKRDDIGIAKYRLLIGPCKAGATGESGIGTDVIRQNPFRLEPEQVLNHQATDAAYANDAYGEVTQPAANVAVPDLLAHAAIGGRSTSEERDYLADRQFSYRR